MTLWTNICWWSKKVPLQTIQYKFPFYDSVLCLTHLPTDYFQDSLNLLWLPHLQMRQSIWTWFLSLDTCEWLVQMFQMLRRRHTTERRSKVLFSNICVKNISQRKPNISDTNILKSYIWGDQRCYCQRFVSKTFSKGSKSFWHKGLKKLLLRWSKVLLSKICVKNISERKPFPPFSSFHI